MDITQLKDAYDAVGGMDGIKKGVSSVSSLFSKSKKKKEEDKEPANQENNAEVSADSSTPGKFYSPELERLIEMVLEDGDVSEREMELLSARAEKEGIDPFEFEIVISKRLRQKKEQAERLKNPVTAMAEAFKMAEAMAKGGKSVVNGGLLSSALSLIPGVGQAAAVGGLAASLIKTPSNLNALKAEIISNAVIPEEEKYLSDFMLFCHTQREVDIEKKRSNSNSMSGFLSSMTVGDSLDLIPIWDTKIKQLIARGRTLYPHSELIKTTIAQVYETPAMRLRKEKSRDEMSFYRTVSSLTVPEDNQELLEVVAFLFENSAENDIVKEAHKSMYKVAERRFSGNKELTDKLKLYKVKKFGFF